MKTINFSVKEILPSLLDKSKTQTIRKAFFTQDELIKMVRQTGRTLRTTGYILNGKPPAHKVGDKVKLYWNQRSKYDWFRKCDGTPHKGSAYYDFSNSLLQYNGLFNKLLGTVEITTVDKIEMCYNEQESWIDSEPQMSKKNYEDLARWDGFKSAEQMFKTLDKMYDLSSPKEFWVYRWKWLK